MNRLTSSSLRAAAPPPRYACPLADDVEPALGGQFGPPLGDQGDLVGSRLDRDRNDSRLDRHFEVEPRLDRLAQQPKSRSWMWRRSSRRWMVMPSARRLGLHGRPDRVGLPPARACRSVATWSMFTPRRGMMRIP